MEILTKENLVGAKVVPTAVSTTFTPLLRGIRLPYHCRDPVSPYRIQNPPRPENPRKLLKNYNLAHPGPVPKITEKLLRSVIFTNILRKNYTS